VRILIIEDDRRIAEPLADDLRRQQHVIDVADHGVRGWELARSGVYDVVLLDIMLPGMDGIEIARRLRAERCSSLILMLTARDSLDDKVRSLDSGADDYVVKPFALSEVSARVRALGRRGYAERDAVITRGILRLDTAAQQIFVETQPIALTPTEFAILEVLLRHPRQTFSKTALLAKVTPFSATAGEDSIKVHITNLRRKIRDAGGSYDPIATMYGYGYRLAAFE
jgi:DNA-binding response OmpR family regulator